MSFQSVMFSAERNVKELQKYLSLPLKPLTLRHLHGLHLSQHDEILGYTRELAVRTARSYAAFFDPVVQHCLEKVPRLPWAKEVSLREFQFCVQLQEVAEKYVWEKKRLMGLPTEPSHPYSSSPAPSSTYSVLEDENLSSTRNRSQHKLQSSFRCETYSSPVRDKIVSALQRGEITLSALPFETALALLRPEHSLLHVLVNETHIDYLPLNLWFSKFCQRRVAWRVLHEHLLHVLQPIVFPYVIEKGTDVLDLVYHAADVVMEIHAMRPIMDDKEALLINAKLDDHILQTKPTAPLVCASNSSLVSGEPVAATQLPLYPSSDVIYAVDSHLKYVFRELLKNAYAAVVVSKPQVELEVKAAQDDQWVTVDVADQGHGIDPRYDNDIWRFGFTTSADSENLLEGFGVGLPTSKVYMDLWGGHIEAYSSEQGTTMRVRFPKAPTEQMVPDSPQFWPEEIR